MAHIAKYTRGSCGGLTKHFERAKDEQGRYYRFKNQEIDLTRTPLNYNLAPDRQSQLGFIKNRLNEVYCHNRADVKVMGSWVVTVPQTVPEEYQREFFERTYKFLADRYGEKNVISAYVHMDETTPHMHFAFIPVVYDKGKNREKVSAKEVINKADLRSFHTDLQEVMNEFTAEHDHAFECDILNGATDNGNLTVQGLKAQDLAERNEIEAEVINEMTDYSAALAAEVEQLTAEKRQLTGEVEQLRSSLLSLKESERNLTAAITVKAREFSQKNFATMAEYQGWIKAHRADITAEKRLNLLEKFVELPAVKEIFEKFKAAQERADRDHTLER